MFLANSGKAYSKDTREEEFIRYFRDTGAASAFEKGMITLFQMPIKPTNVVEYFAEYLGNGAQQLIRLSLLKAELCYKHSETVEMQQRIHNLEEQIRVLEPFGIKKVTKEEEPKMMDYTSSGGFDTAYDPMQRFLEDLEDAPRGSVITTAQASQTSIQRHENLIKDQEEKEENILEDSGSSNEGDEAGASIMEFEESFDVKCIKETNAELAFLRDIKNLDPWGLVCNFQTAKSMGERKVGNNSVDNSKANKRKMSRGNGKEEMSVMESEAFSMESELYNNYDSDDAETLAEIYQTLAIDTSGRQRRSTNEMELLAPEKKLLSVRKGRNLSMGDLLGWTPKASMTNVQEDQLSVTKSPRHWSQYYAQNDQESVLSLDLKKSKKSQAQRGAGGDGFEEENGFYDEPGEDESFLLDERMQIITEKLAKASKAWNDESCVLNFGPQNGEEEAEMCAQNCKLSCMKKAGEKKKKVNKNGKKEQGTMTINEATECPCGEDCDCNCQTINPLSKYGSGEPGKMKNWTLDDCYPGEDYDLLGEDENLRCFKKKPKSSKTPEVKKSSLEETIMKEALAPTPETGCECPDDSSSASASGSTAGSSISLSDCLRTCDKSRRKSDHRGSKNEETMTLTSKQLKKLTEEPTQDLAEVFKAPVASSQGKQRKSDKPSPGNNKNLKRNSKGKKLSESDREKRPYLSDVYQVDLKTEVQRKFGF